MDKTFENKCFCFFIMFKVNNDSFSMGLNCRDRKSKDVIFRLEYNIEQLERYAYKIRFGFPVSHDSHEYKKSFSIKIASKEYYFHDEKYMEFLRKLESDFDLGYIYNPTLVLMEYNRGNFRKAKKMVIELDHKGADIKKTGELFESIFEIAKKYVDINDFSNVLLKNELKNGLFESVIKILDNKLITEIHDRYGEIKRFKIS